MGKNLRVLVAALLTLPVFAFDAMDFDEDWALASATAFNPLNISDCVLWLDGADGATMFDSVSGGSQSTNGGAVALWVDKSGVNFGAQQTDAGKYPARQNGIVFNGISSSLFVTNASINSFFSIFIVQQCTNDNYKFFIEQGIDAGSVAVGFYFAGLEVAAWAVRRPEGLDYGSSLSGLDWVGSDREIAEFLYNSERHDMYLSGVLYATNAAVNQTIAESIVTDRLNIGSRNQTSLFLIGTIHEIILYNRFITDADRKRVEAYLAKKWDIMIE